MKSRIARTKPHKKCHSTVISVKSDDKVTFLKPLSPLPQKGFPCLEFSHLVFAVSTILNYYPAPGFHRNTQLTIDCRQHPCRAGYGMHNELHSGSTTPSMMGGRPGWTTGLFWSDNLSFCSYSGAEKRIKRNGQLQFSFCLFHILFSLFGKK